MSRHFTRVLAVEDDPDIGMVILLALELDADVRAIVVGSGAEALRCLADGPAPDLVLIDDHLPDTDGISLVAAMRQAGHGEVRFAFLTASIRDADRARFIAAGAIGVFAKPFNPLILAWEIQTLLAADSRPSSP
ncbi:response regulator [Sphingomonas sp. LR60]|jgi:CheY-like chemotaxis protein|uniref:response regulator n=1 Tax=Sphingomonas sp. LR60 TaxID=3050233 RepID=UPI002FE2C002